MQRPYYLIILSFVLFLCSQTTFSQACDQVGDIVPFEADSPSCEIDYAIQDLASGDLITNIDLPSQYEIGDRINFGGVAYPPTNFFICAITGDTVLYGTVTCVEISDDCVEPLLEELFVNADCADNYDPVCGCNGITYDNNCEATAAGVVSFISRECVCGVSDIWELEWLNNLTDIYDSTYNLCNVAQIQQFTFEGNAYFTTIPVIPTGNSNCPIDNNYVTYDCQGNVICVESGELGSTCSFESPTDPVIVWDYSLLNQIECDGCEPYPIDIQPDPICGVANLGELEWLNDLKEELEASDGCTIGSIYRFKYNDEIYFQANPGYGDNCIQDADMFLYDCEGNLLCTFSDEGSFDCPFDVFEANTNSFEVWTYPCICPDVYEPVCGMDGVLYDNECEATCEGVDIFPEGECQIIGCGVSSIWQLDWFNELIGTANGYNIENIQQFDYNGGTYFQVNPVSLIPDGPIDVYDCTGNLVCTFYYDTTEDCPFDVPTISTNSIEIWSYDPGPCYCSNVLLPVCGVDGNTYVNECEAICAGVPVLYDGICEDPTTVNMCEVGIKMFLQGALLNTTDGLMRDDLRTNGMLPFTEPYSNSPYFTHVGGGGETATVSAFSINGQNAITDWVFLELRDANFNLIKTRSALLQRDGDVVEVDGVSLINFNVPNGNYHVCVRHRNHLGTMTNNTMNISSTSATTVDFTNIATYGTNAQMAWNDNINALWAGHTNNTGSISFQGIGNNINLLFFEVLGAPNNLSNAANYIYEGYNEGDINMDGSTIYQGNNNDATNVFFTTIQHPQNDNYITNYIIYQQMP